MAVIGPASPLSTITSMARADTPTTSVRRKATSYGMWASNHAACSAMRRMWAVFSGFSWKTMPSKAPLRPRASRYTSMKPLMVSTADVVSATHAMS